MILENRDDYISYRFKKAEERYGKLHTKLFDFRQKGDYGDFFDFDEALVRPLIDEVNSFLQEIKKLLE